MYNFERFLMMELTAVLSFIASFGSNVEMPMAMDWVPSWSRRY